MHTSAAPSRCPSLPEIKASPAVVVAAAVVVAVAVVVVAAAAVAASGSGGLLLHVDVAAPPRGFPVSRSLSFR